MYRLDYMHLAGVRAGRYACMQPLQLKVSEYLRRNVWVTTSGMPAAPAIRYCQEVLGEDRVLYAMDYPYQYEADEVRLSDAAPMSAATRRKFFQTNAEELFGFRVQPRGA
jgi:2,3-dihydroxybenzoate decarboxylase